MVALPSTLFLQLYSQETAISLHISNLVDKPYFNKNGILLHPVLKHKTGLKRLVQLHFLRQECSTFLLSPMTIC